MLVRRVVSVRTTREIGVSIHFFKEVGSFSGDISLNAFKIVFGILIGTSDAFT